MSTKSKWIDFIRRHKAKIKVTLALILGLGLYLLAKKSNIPFQDFHQVQAYIVSYGPWAFLAYLVALIFLPFLFFPASIIVMAGGMLFCMVKGTILTALGSTLSSVLAYYLAHFLGKDLVDEISQGKILALIEDRKGFFLLILLLRLIPLFPFKVVSFAAGAAGVPFWPYLWATTLGTIPGNLAYTLLGTQLYAPKSRGFFLALGVLAALILLTLVLKKILKPRLSKSITQAKTTLSAPLTPKSQTNHQDLSILVPSYQEEANIIPFLENILAMVEHTQPPMDVELILADGGSQDRTLALAETFAKDHPNPNLQIQILTTEPGRGKQLKAAGEEASGQIFWILHVDSQPREDSLTVIRNVLSTPIPGNPTQTYQAGSFRMRFFDDRSWQLRLVELGSHLRSLMKKEIYGDQGLFLLSDVYRELGGFAPWPLMEDLEFSQRLRKAKVPTRVVFTPLGTSARRFQEGGVWKTVALMQRLKRQYRAGVSPEDLAKTYRKQDGKKE